MAWQFLAMAAISMMGSAMNKPEAPVVPQPAPLANTDRPTVVLGVQDDAEEQLEVSTGGTTDRQSPDTLEVQQSNTRLGL